MRQFGRKAANDQAKLAWRSSASMAALTVACALSFTLPASAESLRDAMTAAYQFNPKLDAERARLRATDEDVGRAESGYRPTISGSADIGRQDTTSTPSSSTSGETRARVRQAKHTHVSRMQEIEQARTETQPNVTTAWSRLMAARAQIKSDRVQVEANRLALEGVREEEKVGQRTLQTF